MKRLSIKLFETANCERHDKEIEKIFCNHLDASSNITTLTRAQFYSGKKEKEIIQCYVIPAKISHIHLMDGLITIFYTSGFHMIISRIND